MKRYKAILIDWDDTIGDFSNAAYKSLQTMFNKHGLSAHYTDFEQFYKIYEEHNLDLWRRYGLDEVTKDYLEFDRMFYPLCMAENPLCPEENIRLAQIMQDEHLTMTTQFFSLLPDSEEVVRYLSSKYSLVVLSNGFVSVQYKKINRSGLRNYFADIVLSEEVGCQKPNPRIYEIALERGGWKPDEVLMIGDSWTSDIQGAIASGIDQLWIHEGETDLPSTYKVSHFRDVMTLL